MLKKVALKIKELFPAEEVEAHCDGPCGVYDPASARIAGEAVLSMTKKLLALDGNDVQHHNTFSRYVAVKEEQAQLAKDEVLILWTDYFKPQHLEQYPNLHDKFWKAAKLCSDCKQEVNLEKAEALMNAIKEIHEIFWATKGRDVPWITAS